MWKAIRLHPWRLEIVPAAAFALTVWSAYVYQTRLAWFVSSVPELREKDAFQQMPWWMIGQVTFFWVLAFGMNQRWVQSELRKRYNWTLLACQPVMLMYAWLAYSIMSFASWAMHPVTTTRPFNFLLLGVLTVGGLGLTALLEWSRRYVPREETLEPQLSAQSGDHSRYRERQIDWLFLPTAPLMLAMVVGACTQATLDMGDIVMLLTIGILGAGVFLSLSVRTLTVTPALITYRFGLIPLRYSIAEVVSIAVAHHETFMQRRDKKRKVLGVTDGRCIEITMTNGRVYRLGALRPSHICELIGKPAPQSEPEAES